MATLTVFEYALNMAESRVFDAAVEEKRDDAVSFRDGIDRWIFGGGFKYDDNRDFTSGNAVSFIYQENGANRVQVTGFNLTVEQVSAALESPGDNFTALQRLMFSGADTLTGNSRDDYLIGYAGNDSMYGSFGNDTLDGDEVGGAGGNDTIDGAGGNDVIRGLLGNDLLYGDVGNDDLNGNQGADTLYGGDNIDVVRGGQGDDLVYGDANSDSHLNGNVGNDTVYGGDSQDALFGGQDNDRLFGDAGNDTLSGDLGNDTLTGGAGADRFVMGTNAPGNDVVTDFGFSEGDRLQIPSGATWTAANASGSAVITLSSGGTITLQGISAGSVVSNWFV